MTPRAVANYRIVQGALVRTLICEHALRIKVPRKLDLRTLPKTVHCPECEAPKAVRP